LEIRLLGSFGVAVDGARVDDKHWVRRKPQLLVKLLALQPGHQLHREQVMDTLWPQLDPHAAANQLYKTLHLARRGLEPDLAPGGKSRFLVVSDQLVRLRAPGGVWVDADAFEEQAAAALRSADTEAAEAALALYGGDLLPGDLYEDWAGARRERLRGLRLHLLAHLAGLYTAGGERRRGEELLLALLACDPCDESAHRSLMLLYHGEGNRARALQQYRECRDALRRELDAEPDAETRRLYARISAEEERVPVLEPRPAGEPSPAAEATVLKPIPARAFPPRTAFGPRRVERPFAARLLDLGARPATRKAVALCVLLALAALLLPGTPWSPRLRYKAARALAKAEATLAGGPKLISVAGRLDAPGARVEVLDSVSGWAAFADGGGRFLLLDVSWYPGATYDVVVSTGPGATRLVRVRAPAEFPEDGVFDLGELSPEAGRAVDAASLFGVNSVTYVEFDAYNAGYYRGVFDTLTLDSATDEAKLDAVNRFVASRYRPSELAWHGRSPRRVLEQGSGHSGHLSLAMATIAHAGGYPVRLVDMTDGTNGRQAHRVVEVFYAGGWHAYDPSYGLSVRGPDERVASLETLRRNPWLVPDALIRGAERPGWFSNKVPHFYRSGSHHYYYFKPEPAGETTARAVSYAPGAAI
jgi:DNA-binding SARP family transcriptional activator